ncbi:MAG: hypothetical protein IJQ89_11655 [Bacteroidales bacterium]|nr:hypothetical protein [Bacteroidales bacterium]
MKKLGIILMSALMLVGMSQCKKNNELASTNSIVGGTRTITLKVSDDGSKVSVNPNTGAVGFTSGDVIYVAYNGVYAGTLTHDGSDFTGPITTSAADGAKLTFYFLGNKTPNETLSGATSLSVSIFDQTENYPVISAGLSNEDYDSSVDTYTATLNNHCALVKFNITNSSQYAPTIITGVNDKVTVTFAAGAAGTFANSQDRGAVKLASGNGERWAICLPQEASGIGAAYSEDLRYNGTHGSIPTVMDNGYLTNGIDVTVSNALSGFTVASGTVRFFAPGNLQATYNGSNWTWAFAKNQYDYVGNATANTAVNGSMSVSTNGTVDLFGFNGASSSLDNYGINNSTDNADYGATLSETLKSDWGNNTITNGYGKTWSTPTTGQWKYVFDSRTPSSGVKYAKAQVGGKNGVILVPDDWSTSYYTLTSTNTANANYTTNVISLADWTACLEANGAVFLPAAGYRDGASVYGVGSYGYYWSSTAHSSSATSAYYVYFYSSTLNPQGYDNRYRGRSVRLVAE